MMKYVSQFDNQRSRLLCDCLYCSRGKDRELPIFGSGGNYLGSSVHYIATDIDNSHFAGEHYDPRTFYFCDQRVFDYANQ